MICFLVKTFDLKVLLQNHQPPFKCQFFDISYDEFQFIVMFDCVNNVQRLVLVSDFRRRYRKQ